MIRYVSGDILLSDAKAIAHGVAPNDDFGQGLAHTLRDNLPAMYKDFRHFCHTQHPKSGSLWTWGGAEGPRIVALFTQDGAYGHGAKPGKATTAHVNHALKELAKEVRQEGWTSLALPRLATGVGGLDWQEVKPLIEHHLGDLGIPVLVYETYRPQQAADEGLTQHAA
ncbi:Appr-1-p processing protein [Ahniella affigens]|uniref:Appr-1-p processing protein n=1 Tax=Ahniella affigens TaxID=2021234 RepID=A0A2P1PRI3_9GAMM|nr:macro domain-containing protein [Ahniella affigens]AVP97459.1 Appr-1-p processing protein [Ahniella affigens]